MEINCNVAKKPVGGIQTTKHQIERKSESLFSLELVIVHILHIAKPIPKFNIISGARADVKSAKYLTQL